MQAAILAGGLGTRLHPLTEKVPKALTPVNGRPFIEYQLELLRKGGVDDFVLCVGNLGEAIERYLGDGRAFGCSIAYSYDGPKLLGPAGALRRASSLLHERFFVTYGDAYLRAPYGSLMGALVASEKLAMMAVYRNRGRFGKSDIVVRRGSVVRYDKARGSTGMEWINYGVTALHKQALELIPAVGFCDEEAFYGSLIRRGELGAFEVRARFYEIGTPASLSEFESFIGK